MDDQKVPSLFFFLLGVVSVYPWNSFLNLSLFFEESFEDPQITQQYTLSYYAFTPLAIILTFYIEKKVGLLAFIRAIFIIMVIFFNLLYPICAIGRNSIIKYVLFHSTVVGLSISHFIFEVT